MNEYDYRIVDSMEKCNNENNYIQTFIKGCPQL